MTMTMNKLDDVLVPMSAFTSPTLDPPDTVSPSLARAIDDWGFVASNAQPPVVRMVVLLEHAVRRFPRKPIARSTVAMIVFGLEREPSSRSPYVRAIVAMYRRVDGILKRSGRRLLRLGASIRASVDGADARDILLPRATKRARGVYRNYLQSIRGCEELALRDERMIQSVTRIVEIVLSPEDRAYRLAFLAAAGSARTLS
jgi:hypothetical protein